MEDLDGKFARETILEVVQNQIRDRTPPETKETFDRLISEGFPKLDFCHF